MSTQIPATGPVRVRILQVNTLTQGELVHDVKVRVIPRIDGDRPTMLRIRDEVCPRPPRAGDRMRLIMQVGQVAGVEMLKPKRDGGDAAAAAEVND